MNIIYVSGACSKAYFLQHIESIGLGVPQQVQKYNLLLAEGFADHGEKVTMITSRPINRQMEKRFWMKAEHERADGLEFQYIAFANYPVLRNLCIMLGAFWRILVSKCNGSETLIVCDALNISAAIGSIAAAFLRGMATMCIVTDIPGLISGTQKVSWQRKLNLAIMRSFQSYLLLTKQMSDIVNPHDRPYIVLEGHADQAMVAVENTLEGKHKKKVCLYAGSLMEIYGIGMLVEGFLAAAVPDTELHIYGDGDYVSKLERLTATNECVKYMGVASNSEIVNAELAATLLVNPRPSHEEYTKYSFPSKNMEYMASGTPVLTTRLPGMPEDHKPYVYFIEQENPEGIKDALRKILSQDAATLHAFGARAKEYILREKNNRAQAKKVLEFARKQRTEYQNCG